MYIFHKPRQSPSKKYQSKSAHMNYLNPKNGFQHMTNIQRLKCRYRMEIDRKDTHHPLHNIVLGRHSHSPPHVSIYLWNRMCMCWLLFRTQGRLIDYKGGTRPKVHSKWMGKLLSRFPLQGGEYYWRYMTMANTKHMRFGLMCIAYRGHYNI